MTVTRGMPGEVTSSAMGEASLPRSGDGTISLQELFRHLAEDVTNEVIQFRYSRIHRIRRSSCKRLHHYLCLVLSALLVAYDKS